MHQQPSGFRVYTLVPPPRNAPLLHTAPAMHLVPPARTTALPHSDTARTTALHPDRGRSTLIGGTRPHSLRTSHLKTVVVGRSSLFFRYEVQRIGLDEHAVEPRKSNGLGLRSMLKFRSIRFSVFSCQSSELMDDTVPVPVVLRAHGRHVPIFSYNKKCPPYNYPAPGAASGAAPGAASS